MQMLKRSGNRERRTRPYSHEQFKVKIINLTTLSGLGKRYSATRADIMRARKLGCLTGPWGE